MPKLSSWSLAGPVCCLSLSVVGAVLLATASASASSESDSDSPSTIPTSASSSSSAIMPNLFTLLSLRTLFLAVVLPAAVTSPFWLPPYVIALRMFLFTKINGDDGMQFPNDKVGPDQWKSLYSNKSANLRSRQTSVGLSDLFWYFLCPGPMIHQEHTESGTELHRMVHLGTKMMLAVPTERVLALAEKHMRRRLCTDASGRPGIGLPSQSVVRLRDFFFPMFTRFWFDVLFDEDATDEECALLTASGTNVINALKCTELRDMATRDKVTELVKAKLAAGKLADVVKEATSGMSPEERALHVQGVFFTTGAVQMSEALCHAALALASHPECATHILNDDASGSYLDRFVTESLRTWPLFGIAHRIASADITTTGVNGKPVTIPKHTVMCFNYPAYHAVGYKSPSEFRPDRWLTLKKKDAHYAPFGMMRNRPCPAQRVALLAMKAMIKVLVERASLVTSVRHDRSLPSRGPCVITPNVPLDADGTGLSAPAPSSSPIKPQPISRPSAVVLKWMKVRDTLEGLPRSLSQLVYGTWMVMDAKRQKLAQRYQEGITPLGPRPDYHLAPESAPTPPETMGTL